MSGAINLTAGADGAQLAAKSNKNASPTQIGHRAAVSFLGNQSKGVNRLQQNTARKLFAQVAKGSRQIKNTKLSGMLAQANKVIKQLKTSSDREKSKSKLLDELKEGGTEGLSDSDVCFVLKTFKGGQQMGQGGSQFEELNAELQKTVDELIDDLYTKNADEVDAKDILSFIESTQDDEENRKNKKRKKLWWCNDEDLTEIEIILLLNLVSIEEFMQLVKKGMLKIESLPLYQRVVSYKSFQKDSDNPNVGHINITAQNEVNQALAHKTMELAGVSWLITKIERIYNSNTSLSTLESELKKELGKNTAFFVHELATQTASIEHVRNGLMGAFKEQSNENSHSSTDQNMTKVAKYKRDEQLMTTVAKFVRSAVTGYIAESPNKARNIQRLDALMQQFTEKESTESFIWRLA